MKRVIIVGAGGFGREIHGWAQSFPDYGKNWSVAGYLDDSKDNHDSRYGDEPPILGALEDYVPSPGEELILAIGAPNAKLEISKRLEAKGAKFSTFVHPSAIVAKNCTIGRGTILCPHAVIGAYAKIGAFVTINVASSVGHDADLQDGVTLSAHCDVTGYAVLEEGVFLGSHATVLPGIRVGAYATLGAGSVATRKLKQGTSYFGLPAKSFLG